MSAFARAPDFGMILKPDIDGDAEHYLLETSRDRKEWHTLATTKTTNVVLDAAHIPFEGKG